MVVITRKPRREQLDWTLDGAIFSMARGDRDYRRLAKVAPELLPKLDALVDFNARSYKVGEALLGQIQSGMLKSPPAAVCDGCQLSAGIDMEAENPTEPFGLLDYRISLNVTLDVDSSALDVQRVTSALAASLREYANQIEAAGQAVVRRKAVRR